MLVTFRSVLSEFIGRGGGDGVSQVKTVVSHFCFGLRRVVKVGLDVNRYVPET